MNFNVLSEEEIQYKYKELVNLYIVLCFEILRKKNPNIEKNNNLMDDLCAISILYPEEKNTVKNVINIIYSNNLITEKSLNELVISYKKLLKYI